MQPIEDSNPNSFPLTPNLPHQGQRMRSAAHRDPDSDIARSRSIPVVENATILTPTSGFLKTGYTHTINVYKGCAFAGSLCGTFCYAQHNRWITRGRAWGLYGVKQDIREAYHRDYARIKRPRRGAPKPLRIYMSSSTDPYLPQEKTLCLTRSLLDEMRERPPDVLVVQSHSTLVERDIDLIAELAARCELWVSLTVETDMDSLPGFPPHGSPPARRLKTLARFRARGILTQAAVSPLLPLADPQEFAHQLDAACDRVIVDHYLIGDGSPNGWRTRRTTFAERLERAGFGAWNALAKLWEVRDLLADVMGASRVLVGCDGFNAVGLSLGSSQESMKTRERRKAVIAIQGGVDKTSTRRPALCSRGLIKTDEPSGGQRASC
jgi:DNA repair photolyase